MKNTFKFPMLSTERALGCVYIPVHVILPYFIAIVLEATGHSFGPVYNMLIHYTTSFIIVLMIAFRFLRKSFSDLLDGFIRVIQAVILGYAFFFAMAFVLSLILPRLVAEQADPNTARVLELVRQDYGVMMVITVVLAPIIEETLFRGAVFGSLRQKNRVLAYIITALLFAVYHLWPDAAQGFSWTLPLFALRHVAASIALSWCYERGGTVWAPILLHAAINFISTSGILG